MGMFDEVKCSYNIGELTDVVCQTKNMDDWGGSMSFYWVDPAGQLWTPSWSGTYDFVEGDKVGVTGIKYLDTVPNGNHGRYIPLNISRCIEMYNIKTYPDGAFDETTCYLQFRFGMLVDFMYK